MSTRVLVVDDSLTIRVAVSKLLERHEMDVESVADAESALAKLLDAREEFDVVVSDLMMPGLNGNDLVNTIRTESRLDGLPVLILTSSKASEDQHRNLEEGASDYVQKPYDDAVLVARVRNLARMKQMRDRLERLSRTDPLTGLANRRYATARLREEIARSRRYGHPIAVCLIDIDHFKKINDTLGHQAGDEVLVRVASEIASATRASDLVVRWGGEEFLVVFPETDLERASLIMERFRAHLASVALEAYGQRVPVTVSGGVAELRDGDTADDLVNRADEGLYAAKEAGRNRLLAWQLDQLVPVAAV